jgi:hypothetical protein
VSFHKFDKVNNDGLISSQIKQEEV